MEKVVWGIIDYSLLLGESYLLIRIALSKNTYFKTPFFFFFLLTGTLGCLSVVGFLIANRYPIPAYRPWVYKIGTVISLFGNFGSTLGKLCIVAHRYAVMRSVTMRENVWTYRLSYYLTGVIIMTSCLRCIPLFFCDYSFVIREGVEVVATYNDQCNFAEKINSSVMYFLFVVASVVLTSMTIRLLYNIRRISQQRHTNTTIVKSQWKLFIIVLVCTISHLIKALHQLSWVFAAYFHLTEFNLTVVSLYVYPHYIATYSASITLIIFSSRVRLLLIRRDVDELPQYHASNPTATRPTAPY